MPVEAFLINPKRGRRKRKINRARRKPTLYRVRANSRRKNPLGEEVILVGANPRRKRRHRKNVWRGHSAGHARAARKGWVHRRRYSANPRRRSRRYLMSNPKRHYRRRKRYLMDNPRRHHRSYRRNYRRRHYRRNPATALSGINIMRPMTLVMPLIVGFSAKWATERVPAMVGITSPMTKLGVQVGVMAAGGILLRKPLGSTNAAIWTIMSGVVILTDVLNTYVFSKLAAPAATAGFSAFPSYRAPGAVSYDQGMSAYPEELGFGAYPYDNVVQY
jgi:hypothetical protein